MRHASKVICIVGCFLLAGAFVMNLNNVTSGAGGGTTINVGIPSHKARLKSLYLGNTEIDNPVYVQMFAGENGLKVDNGLVVYGDVNDPHVTNSSAVIIGGGRSNILNGATNAGILGGQSNKIGADNGVIGGGRDNEISGLGGVVAGGHENEAGGGVVLGGMNNSALGDNSVILGGSGNMSQGGSSLILGVNARAKSSNNFVWNDTVFDVNNDGKVDLTDVLFMNGRSVEDYYGEELDFNNDGVVNDLDFSYILNVMNMGSQVDSNDSAYIGALKGALIGTYQPKDGVNLVVNGAISLGSSDDPSGGIGGEIIMKDGCFYAYDGETWHVLGKTSESQCDSLNDDDGEGGDCSKSDFNGDGKVDIADFITIKESLYDCGISPIGECLKFDLNGDGKVDISDFIAFKKNWSTCGVGSMGEGVDTCKFGNANVQEGDTVVGYTQPVAVDCEEVKCVEQCVGGKPIDLYPSCIYLPEDAINLDTIEIKQCNGVKGGESKAGEPKCNKKYHKKKLDNLIEGTHLCNPGILGGFRYDEDTRRWTWTCTEKTESVDCYATKKEDAKSYACIGTIPENASLIAGSDLNLSGDVEISLYASTGAAGTGKCACVCNSGFVYSGSTGGVVGGNGPRCIALEPGQVLPKCNPLYNKRRVGNLTEGNRLCNPGTIAEFGYDEDTHRWTWVCSVGGNSLLCFATKPYCGDGIKDGDEACDDGQNNGKVGSSCSSTCTVVGDATLLPGDTINGYMNDLAKGLDKIVSFERWDENGIPAGVQTQNIAESGTPVEIWYAGETIYYYTQASKVYFNKFSYNMFKDLTNVVSIDVEGWDTSKVTDMHSMFYNCKNLKKLDVSNFDTSKVTNMTYMFASNEKLTSLDVSNWDTKLVTDMSFMFQHCMSLTSLNVSNFDTSKVTNMAYMFDRCINLTSLDVSNFDTSKVTSMTYMFNGCKNLTTLDVSNFDTSLVTDTVEMFNDCINLQKIYASQNFKVAQIPHNSDDRSRRMFENSTQLKGGKGTEYDSSHINKEYARIDCGLARPGYFSSRTEQGYASCPSVPYLIRGDSVRSEMESLAGSLDNITSFKMWNGNGVPSDVETKNIAESGTPVEIWYNNGTIYYYTEAGKIYLNADSSQMFYDMNNLAIISTLKWDTSKVTNMSNMFYDSEKLTSLDVSNWNTSKVTNMASMFHDCVNLKKLDVSNWDTSKVTSMARMFAGCEKLTSINVSNWDTKQVTDMSDMFSRCLNLMSLDVSNWDTSKVTNMAGMFALCYKLTSIDVEGWDTKQVTDMNHMFGHCTSLKNLDVSNFDTSKVTNMDSMFFNCSNLTDINVSNWDTKQVTGMDHMFGLTKIASIDVSNWDTSNVQSMFQMFASCRNLTSLDVSNFNTSKVTSMARMFAGNEALTTIYVSENFNVDGVTDSEEMFAGCTSLVGGNGTLYDSSKVDKTYARIDGMDGKLGYFTPAR